MLDCRIRTGSAVSRIISVARLRPLCDTGCMSERPWYRLHWVTWVAVVICGCFFLYVQFVIEWTFVDFQSDVEGIREAVENVQRPVWWRSSRGWPIRNGPENHPWSLYHWLYPNHWYALNYLAFLLVTVSTAFVVEQLIRALGKRLQYRISTLFSITAVVAAVVAVSKHPGINLGGRRYVGEIFLPDAFFYPAASDYIWYIRFPLLVLLGFTIYAALWLAVRGIKLLFWKTDTLPQS